MFKTNIILCTQSCLSLYMQLSKRDYSSAHTRVYVCVYIASIVNDNDAHVSLLFVHNAQGEGLG